MNHDPAPALAAIIVPVYKVEQLLRRCLDSILAQTWSNWIAILVDDGSPDGSGAICDEYAARDARFRVIHQENGGVSRARNAALDALDAGCELVFFADADDCLSPVFLSGGISLHRRWPADLVSWDSCDRPEELCCSLSADLLVDSYSQKTLLDYYFTWNICPVWNKVFPVWLFREAGVRFEERLRLSEDTLFVLECLSHLYRRSPDAMIRYVRLPLYCYDTSANPGSLCHTIGTQYLAHQYVILPRTIQAFRNFGYDDPALERLYHRYVQAVCYGLEQLVQMEQLFHLLPRAPSAGPPHDPAQVLSLRQAGRHPEFCRLLDYFSSTGIYSAYYIPLKLRCWRWTLLLFHSQQTEEKFWYWKFYWLGRWWWQLFHKPPKPEE